MRKTGTKPFFSLSRGVKPPLQLFALHDQTAAVLVFQRDGEGIDGVAVQQLGHIRETLADQVLF